MVQTAPSTCWSRWRTDRSLLDLVADIRTYAAAGEVALRTDRMRQDAIIRKLAVIGEAVKHLSDDTRGHTARDQR